MLISQVISLTFNSAQAEFDSASSGMASCILSTSKYFQCLKTTCPICPQRHGENHAPKSAVFVKNIQSKKRKKHFQFSTFNSQLNKMATMNKKQTQVGRKPKADSCRHRYSFNLNDSDFNRHDSGKRSGMKPCKVVWKSWQKQSKTNG